MRNVAFIQTVARAIYEEACVAIRMFLPRVTYATCCYYCTVFGTSKYGVLAVTLING
jgi:hypothetical protein